MAGITDDIGTQVGQLPDFSSAFTPVAPMVQNTTVATPTATGTGNFFTSGLSSGYRGMLADVGRAGQAVAGAVGLTGASKAASDYAAQQQALAQSDANPAIEALPWYHPEALAYRTAQSLPSLGAMLATGGLGEAALGAKVGLKAASAIGAGLGAFPLAVGSNVQAAEDGQGGAPLSQKQAVASLALGLPEAALQSIVPGKLERILHTGAQGGMLSRALTGALATGAYQAPVAAATAALTDLMGDPNRSFADRAQGVINAALQGAAQGAIVGGGIHTLSKAKPGDVTNDQLKGATDASLGIEPAPPMEGVTPPPATGEPQAGPAPTNTTVPGPAEATVPEPTPTPTAVQPAPDATVNAPEVAAAPVPETAPTVSPPVEPVAAATPVAPTPLTSPDFTAEVKAAAGMVPKFLKDDLAAGNFADRDALRVAIAKEIQDRFENGAPLGKQIERLGTKFDVFTDNSEVRPELLGDRPAPPVEPPPGVTPEPEAAVATAPEEPVAPSAPKPADEALVPSEPVPAPEPVATEGSSPPVAEATPEPTPAPEPSKAPLRDAIPDQHKARFDKLEDIRNTVNSLPDDHPDKAGMLAQVDDLQSKLQAPKRGEVQGITKDTMALSRQIDGIKAGIELTKPAPEPVAPEPKPEVKTPPKTETPPIKADPNAPLTTKLSDPKLDLVRQRVNDAQAALDKVKSSDIKGAMLYQDNAKYLPDQLKMKQDRLNEVKTALTSKDPATALSKIDDTHFSLGLNQLHSIKLGRKPEFAAMLGHAYAEKDVIGAIKNSQGKPVGYNDPNATPRDQQLQGVIDSGASGRDVLKDIQRNGASGINKTLATFLLKHNIDPTTRFAPIDGSWSKNSLQKPPRVLGEFNGDTNRISLFNRAGHTTGGGGLEGTVLHEMMHSAAIDALNKGEAAKAAQALFDHLKLKNLDNNAYGLTNRHELISEAFSNPDFQAFLKTQDAMPGYKASSLWQQLKDTIFKALGFPQGLRTAFEQAIDIGLNAVDQQTRDRANANLRDPKVLDQRVQEVHAQAAETYNQSRQEINDELAAPKGEKVAGWLLNKRTQARQLVMGWLTGGHIAESYGKFAPAMADLITHQNRQGAIADSVTKMSKVASDMLHSLPHKTQDLVNKAMQHTILGIDPERPFDEHTWLKPTKTPGQKGYERQAEQYARAKDAYDKLTGDKGAWNAIARDPKALAAYQSARASNEAGAYAKMVYHMEDHVRSVLPDTPVKGFDGTNSFDTYNSRSELHDNPALARDFWKTKAEEQSAGLTEYNDGLQKQIDLNNGATGLSDKAKAKLDGETKKLASLQTDTASLAKDVQDTTKQLSQGAYFHLGREGKYFVGAKLNVGADGLPVQDHIDRIQKEFDKRGWHDIALQRNAENNQLYMRLRDPAEMSQVRRVIDALHTQGWLDKSEPTKAGGDNLNLYKSISPAWMKRAISAAADTPVNIPDGATDEVAKTLRDAHAQKVRDLTQSLMSMLPDNSVSKLYARREGVQGFNADMIHSFDVSSLTQGRGLAGLAVAHDLGTAASQMKDQVKTLNSDPNATDNQRIGTSQAVAELILRDAQRQWNTPSQGLDTVRGLTHGMQIGMNPAYFVTLMSQIPSLSLPELGRSHGFLNSARALAGATGMTFKIMKAVAASQDRTTFGLRREALEKAGIPPKIVDFMMEQAARGSFNQGGYTNSMIGHHAAGSGALSSSIRMMSAMGLYAEMTPRVMTALAAKDLYRGEQDGDLHQFVAQKVSGSQFDWNPMHTPRAVGKGGTFGAASPLFNQFMGFQIRMTEKLYREVHDAFGGDTPEAKAQARKFLLGHLAAVTALSGTLGLPMVGVAASVFDRFADWATGKDDFDVTASYRNWLASTFGKGVGEAIARGAPRLGGVDLDHLGEGSIAPGSTTVKLLTEKRKFEDAEKDWLKSMAGSAVGEAVNTGLALRDVANGDYMNGLIKVAPEGIKGVAEAVRLGNRGFVDKRGAKLPITASAQDIALKAIGIDPANEAEYDEASGTAAGLKAMRTIRSANITNHLVQAQMRGDTADLQKWEGAAQTYQQDHPGLSGPLQNFGRILHQTLQQQTMAQSFGTPLGVSAKDVVGRGMTAFGNFNRQ